MSAVRGTLGTVASGMIWLNKPRDALFIAMMVAGCIGLKWLSPEPA